MYKKLGIFCFFQIKKYFLLEKFPPNFADFAKFSIAQN